MKKHPEHIPRVTPGHREHPHAAVHAQEGEGAHSGSMAGQQHPPGGQHPHAAMATHLHSAMAGHPPHDPAVMVSRFGSMPEGKTDLFTIRKLEFLSTRSGNPSPPIRTNIHCFIFLLKGEVLVSIGDETYLFRANECAVIPAGQFFSVRYFSECLGYMGGFHSDFLTSDNEGRNLLRTFGFLRKWGSHKVMFEPCHSRYLSNIFERLLAENSGSGNKDIIKAYLTTLLVEIDEAYRQGGNSSETGTDNSLCNDFIEYVFRHPDLGHSAAWHSERMNVSVSHLQKTVKRLTGKTPLNWISESVILESKVLLMHTDMPVAAIAQHVGIEDPSYFTRLFRKHVGMSPNTFRTEKSNKSRE